jgi:soluble lytic murein transglycosylase
MKKRLITLTIVLTLFLSSCTRNLTSSPSSSNTSEANPSGPTATATLTPTPTPQAFLLNGESDFINGDYDTALSDLTSAQSSTDPEIIAKATLLIGRIYLQKQNYDKALQIIANLVNTQPAGPSRNTAFFFLAKSYEGLKEYQLAADAYQNYLNLVTDSPIQADILEMMGDDLVSAENYSVALAAFQKAVPLARPEYLEEIQIKAAQATASTGDPDSAITQYLDIYNASNNNYTKSTINLLLGRLYLDQGKSDEAYARFLISVAEFPTTYDTYSGLVALVDANQTVDDLQRGLVDYYNGQYGGAIEAFDRYMAAHPDHDATPIYYKALSYYNNGDYENEVAQWDYLINNYPNDAYYADAFLEKASTQYGQFHQYATAAQTLLAYVAQAPTADNAAAYLYQAGRVYEQGNFLELAAQTWERLIQEYPSYDKSILAEFNAGICYYRLGEYTKALTTFQRNSLLTTNVSDKARAEMWIGKTQQKLNLKSDALNSFQQAVSADPTGYYSLRANELLNGQNPFTASTSLDLGVDLNKEKTDAVDWMRTKFNVSSDVDLLSDGDLASNVLYQRGNAFWELGLTSQAQSEFESLRQQLASDAANSFRLMNKMVDLGFNQTAILCARQILDLLGLGDATLIDQTPAYFNHIRFGVYFREMVVSTAAENNINSLTLFSVIRQESMFEAEITSSQGASGMMQILPAVGEEIAADYGWPANYSESDLIRPLVSIKLGAHYLTKWYNYFDKDMVAALAAYNGGIGNAINWDSLAGSDPDLLLEIIPDNYETQDYIRYIRENLAIYETIYLRK